MLARLRSQVGQLDTAIVQMMGWTSALASYCVNMMHGKALEPFERTHITTIAAELGVKIEPQAEAYGVTRKILDEVMLERRHQVEHLNFTHEHDAQNSLRLHDQVLNRVSQLPGKSVRKELIEAAAILVAEIEVIDRRDK